MTRRSRLPATLLLALGVVLATLLAHRLIPEATAQSADAQGTSKKKVAIVPFAVSSDPDLTGIGDFVPDMLASRLEGRGSFAFADTAPLRGTLPAEEKGLLSADRAAALALRLGADYVVSGTLARKKGAAAFTAQVYRRDGTAVGDRVVIPVKGPDDVLNQLEPLADAVATTLGGAEEAPPPAKAAAAPPADKAQEEAEAKAAAEEKARADAEAARAAAEQKAKEE